MGALSQHSYTAEQARELTDQIRAGMESVYHLIRSAYRGRAWQALGYATWDEYVTREFGNLHLRPRSRSGSRSWCPSARWA